MTIADVSLGSRKGMRWRIVDDGLGAALTTTADGVIGATGRGGFDGVGRT